jgi:5-methylcytosine-specific restriction endonuclease McrA
MDNQNDLEYTNPVNIECPICNIKTFSVFEFLYSCDGKNYFKCNCSNGHISQYIIFFRAGIVVCSFVYAKDKPGFNYSAYLTSAEWKEKSDAEKIKAGWRCSNCNYLGNETTLHVHHKTYKNVGNEKPGDLIVLCRDCHSKLHDKENS